MSGDPTYQHIDSLFRKSYGRIVSLLVSKYGTGELEVIENSLMEAFYAALKTWPYNEIPDNPEAWIYTVSKRKLIDALRKRQRRWETLDSTEELSSNDEMVIENADEIQDSQLRLLFLVCHPALKKEDQLAFMLKTLSGFGIREIAAALLQNAETIKKRLLRARGYIKDKELTFEWPLGGEMQQRLDMVHSALYLLFNEGYYSSHPNQRVRKEFCLEAMQLCKVLSDHKCADADTMALMGLMCYHISRFESRIDDQGDQIILEFQDRSAWDPYFIKLGHHYLAKSSALTDRKTLYQIEAMISCTHCMAKSIDGTNWELLELLYNKLLVYKQSDLVVMNLAVVLMMGGKLARAKKIFESIDETKLKHYKAHYYILGFKLFDKLKDAYLSKYWVAKALKSDNAGMVKRILESFNKN